MECEAVKLWRDKFKLNISASWKHDVEITITDLELWKEILEGWFYFDKRRKKHTKHPGMKGLLDEYERLERRKDDCQSSALQTRDRERVSEGSNRGLRSVRSEAERLYFGA